MLFSPILSQHYDAVIRHLRGSFFAHEPLNEAVTLCKEGEGHVELEAHSLQTMKDCMSIMATDPDNGMIVGVALNGILNNGDLELAIANLPNFKDKKFSKIFGILYALNLKADMFKTYGVEKIFECRILSVDEKYRGRGIAKELLVRSIKTARENGFKVFKEDATSLYSQRIALSCGVQVIQKLSYSDLGPDMKVTPPHTELCVMVKILD